ncbi:uncharacterized protein LOC110444831 [Mizuhopecten yessoensis]|uniref:uncharacterized protein LOC110444831 n=1 Tax=Mizuhopecten yessoensis TaxID=6573 RepID=UPI000B45DC92|nr:uncharacterized protein LOC110444831 [Mizuhopecten yessoensis]
MATKLTQTHRDQHSKWIDLSTRHKFTLLYKISRDGCNPEIFHRYCDNRGPTVTILYNTDKSVYGGYTAFDWKSDTEYEADAQAFLFTLEHNGTAQAMKFPHKTDGTNAIYGKSSYGPTFGDGHDLCCFTATINKSGNIFPLDGKVESSKSYDMKGQDFNSLINGHFNVLELKVYSVQGRYMKLRGIFSNYNIAITKIDNESKRMLSML